MHKQMGVEKQLFSALVVEAQVLKELSQHPHPNLIRFHGCRVTRGHITGLVLDKHPGDLSTHVRDGYGPIDKAHFMAALESAIQHLHGLGWAHNDLNPVNVLVNKAGMPVCSSWRMSKARDETEVHPRDQRMDRKAGRGQYNV